VYYTGSTVDVYFKHPDGTYLDLWWAGANVGAKKLSFKGGVLVANV
jgi:hypothetical protein